jgi:hypothetical protein
MAQHTSDRSALFGSSQRLAAAPRRGRDACERRPWLVIRVRAWWRRSELDQALADGTDPTTSEELCLRAAQLSDPRMAERLAASLEAAVDAAGRPVNQRSPAVPLRRRAIIDARAALLGLVLRLRDPDELGHRGAAMASHLVCSGDSPLFAGSAGESLWAYARRAAWAIDEARDRSAHQEAHRCALTPIPDDDRGVHARPMDRSAGETAC